LAYFSYVNTKKINLVVFSRKSNVASGRALFFSGDDLIQISETANYSGIM